MCWCFNGSTEDAVRKFCIAVTSPFLDKCHGTERCVAEQIERLAHAYGYDVHLYSQQVEDIEGLRIWRNEAGDQRSAVSGRLVWHKIPHLPGPYIVNYLWWFVANHLWRWWDGRVKKLLYDLTYSPGINCLNADVISVHIVFAEFYRRVRSELGLLRNPLRSWPRLMHRRLYYQLIIILERLIYTRTSLPLAVVSHKTAHDLAHFYGRDGHLPVVYHGLDLARFHPDVRTRLRSEARRIVGLPAESFALLLIGNDWKKKGLPCLLEAAGQLGRSNLLVLVVGRDDRAPYQDLIARYKLKERVRFLPLRPDVEFYYAAADAYVGPSLEDAFALPPAEAMACGLPVIVSNRAGVSEIITDGVDGLIVRDPRDATALAELIDRLYESPKLRHRLGENAAKTARAYTWDRNAAEMHALFQDILRRSSQDNGHEKFRD